MSCTPGKTCRGGGGASRNTTRTSLPSWRSAYAMASADPIASPSGRTCEVTTNRCRRRISAATCATVADSVAVGIMLLVLVFRVEVAQDLFDAVLVRDRLVEAEVEFR